MDPAADALTRLRQGSEASVRFQLEHAGYFSLLDVERADAGHAELLREGGDVYLARRRSALVREAQAAGLGRRRRAGRGARPRRARRGVVVDPRLARRAHRPAPPTTSPTFVGAWVERALAAHRAAEPRGSRRRDRRGAIVGAPYRSSAMPPRRRSRQLEASAIAALGPGARHRPVLPARPVRDLAARAARVGRAVLVVRRRLRARRACCCSCARSRRSCSPRCSAPAARRRRARPARPAVARRRRRQRRAGRPLHHPRPAERRDQRLRLRRPPRRGHDVRHHRAAPPRAGRRARPRAQPPPRAAHRRPDDRPLAVAAGRRCWPASASGCRTWPPRRPTRSPAARPR